MSFILDALKKSDAERQRKSTPGYADIPESRRRHRPPRWLWIVGGLLAVNLVAVTALFFRSEPPPVTATPSPPAEGAPSVDATAERSFSDIVAEAREAQQRSGQPSDANAPRRKSPPAGREGTDTQPRESTAQTQTAAAAPRSGAEEATATFESLRGEGTLALPDLHLDIHVYSQQPSDRFVFINMKKYKESDTLAEGPVVREIAPEGVILTHAGKVFLLPRE